VTEDPQGRTNIAEAAKDVREAGNRLNRRAVSMQQVDALLDVLKSYQTGHFAEQKAHLLSVLKGLGFDIPDKAWGAGWSDTDFQIFTTGALKDVLGEVKDIGGVRGYAGIRALERAGPNARLEPDANLHILSQLKGQMLFNNQYDNDLIDLNRRVNSAGGALAGHSAFDANWNKQNRVADFIDDVKRDVGPIAGGEKPLAMEPPKAPVGWEDVPLVNPKKHLQNVEAGLNRTRWEEASQSGTVRAISAVGIPVVGATALMAAFPQFLPAMPDSVKEDALSLVGGLLGAKGKGEAAERSGGRIGYDRGGFLPTNMGEPQRAARGGRKGSEASEQAMKRALRAARSVAR
jgi:hypothetical protein